MLNAGNGREHPASSLCFAQPSGNCRVLVFGDPGTGKTSFVYLLAFQKKLPNPSPTNGCQIEVLTYRHAEKLRAVELWDVGANPQFEKTRKTFYRIIYRYAQQLSSGEGEDASRAPASLYDSYLADANCASSKPLCGVHGLILVHDLSNERSYANLSSWIHELLKENNITDYVWEGDGRDVTFNKQKSKLPILVVGTKKDLAKPSHAEILWEEESGINTIHVCTRDEETLKWDGFLYGKISAFFEKCILNNNNNNESWC